MANRNFTSQKLFSFHAMLVQLDCIFAVAAADAGGLGITGLKGGGVQNVFMHTSQTPGKNAGFTNPNPAAGLIQVQLQDSYYYLYDFSYSIHSPVTGSALNVHTAATLTIGHAYQIVTVGTTTTAEWVTIGLPVGVTPAVGASFVAKAATTGGSHTGTVKAIGVSGITAVELVGAPNLELNPANQNVNGGGIVLLQTLAPTDASTTTLIPTAIPDTSVVRLRFSLSNSSVHVQGD